MLRAEGIEAGVAEPQFYDTTIGTVTDFGNDTRDFELVFDGGKKMEFVAGQFAVVLCPKEGKVIRRAYSIASPPGEQGRLSLIIKLVQSGVVTNWFWTLKTGDKIRIHAPFGKFILPDPIDSDLALIATGTGIAPFRSMIRHLLPQGFSKKIWLLFGARYDTMIPYHPEWLELARRHPNFLYIPTVSRPSAPWKGETGYVQTKIGKFLSDPTGKRVYICGLNEMIEAAREACFKQGFAKGQVFFERYD